MLMLKFDSSRRAHSCSPLLSITKEKESQILAGDCYASNTPSMYVPLKKSRYEGRAVGLRFLISFGITPVRKACQRKAALRIVKCAVVLQPRAGSGVLPVLSG